MNDSSVQTLETPPLRIISNIGDCIFFISKMKSENKKAFSKKPYWTSTCVSSGTVSDIRNTGRHLPHKQVIL